MRLVQFVWSDICRSLLKNKEYKYVGHRGVSSSITGLGAGPNVFMGVPVITVLHIMGDNQTSAGDEFSQPPPVAIPLVGHDGVFWVDEYITDT